MKDLDIHELLKTQVDQRDADLKFAQANSAFSMVDVGDDIPPQEIAYIGITENGERLKLDRVCNAFRVQRAKARRGTFQIYTTGPRVVRVPIRTLPNDIEIQGLGGQCPVQANGFVGATEFYFRARGTHWSMSIGGEELIKKPDWYYEEYYGEWPSAGYLKENEAEKFIQQSAARFRSDEPSMQKRK